MSDKEAKKLSEIGRYVEFEPDGNNWADALDDDSISCVPVIVMTIEERRELVRQLLVMFCKDWIYPDDAWPEIEKAAMLQIEGMIKEQGL